MRKKYFHSQIGMQPWYLDKMVAQNMLRTYDVKNIFSEFFGFEDSFDVTKCHQQNEMPVIMKWQKEMSNHLMF